MRLSIIAAVSDDGIIGRAGTLPWRQPADLARFKRLTTGHHVVMGRRTFESIGRPLPGRRTVVVTRRREWSAAGLVVAHSVEEAVDLARQAGESEAFVAGGAEIYAQTLGRADRLYLTRVHGRFEGDARFPDLDPSAWRLVEREERPPDDRNPHAMSFLLYEAAPVAAE